MYCIGCICDEKNSCCTLANYLIQLIPNWEKTPCMMCTTGYCDAACIVEIFQQNLWTTDLSSCTFACSAQNNCRVFSIAKNWFVILSFSSAFFTAMFVYFYRIQFLRHMKDFFHLEYKISVNKEETDSDSIRREIVTLTCVGVGYSNLTKSLR